MILANPLASLQMPKAAHQPRGFQLANRHEPYSKAPSKHIYDEPDKENIYPAPAPSKKSKSKSQPKEGDYRDVELEEILGEVPCYDNASTVRRKLNNLLTSSSTIPHNGKK